MATTTLGGVAREGRRSVAPPVLSRRLAGSWRRNGPGYLFLTPWLIGFFGLTLGPTVASLYLSFTDYDLLTPARWAGLKNYEYAFFQDRRLGNAWSVTFQYVLWSVPLKLAVALGLAMALDRGVRAVGLYRAIFYLPSLLGASVAIAILWRQIFGANGLVNQLLEATIGVSGPGWVTHPDYALSTLVALAAWQFGSPMIIFLAGLRQIPQDLYEAASMDGAGPFRQFFMITLPLLAPVYSSTWSSRPSRPSRPSPRLSSSRAATAAPSIRPSSTRSTFISKPSRTSGWDMPRLLPGCCSSSSGYSPALRS
jgi:multiple sugar transport system permease protein